MQTSGISNLDFLVNLTAMMRTSFQGIPLILTCAGNTASLVVASSRVASLGVAGQEIEALMEKLVDERVQSLLCASSNANEHLQYTTRHIKDHLITVMHPAIEELVKKWLFNWVELAFKGIATLFSKIVQKDLEIKSLKAKNQVL